MTLALADFWFEVVNFLLLTGGLSYVLFAPVRRALDAERAEHQKREQETQRLVDEARAREKQLAEAREALEHELDERRKEVLANAEKRASSLLSAARELENEQRNRLERELAVRREAEATQLIDELARIAAESVRRLLLSCDGPALDAALVRAATRELERLPRQARDAAVVESAHTLDAGSRELLASLLGSGFEERVVAELGAGIRVTTQQGQVDASALSFARRAATTLKSNGAAQQERSDA